MLNFLHNNWKWLLGFVATIIGILLPIFFQKLWVSKKSLSYEIVSQSKIIEIEKEKFPKLKATFNDVEVNNLNLTIVKIINSGDIAIEKKDFDHPLTIFFEKDTKIFNVDVIEKEPANIYPDTTINMDTVEISPTLFNEGDFITLQILTSATKEPTVNARIIGVKNIFKSEIKNIKDFKRNKRLELFLAIILFIAYILLSSSYFFSIKKLGKFVVFTRIETVLLILITATGSSYLTVLVASHKSLTTSNLLLILIMLGAPFLTLFFVIFGYYKKKILKNLVIRETLHNH